MLKLDTVRQAIAMGTSDLRETDRITLITFNNAAEIVLDAAAYQSETFNRALWNIKAAGGTDVAAPLRTALRARPKERRQVVFLLTDGDPDKGEEGKLDALAAARRFTGTSFTVIGTGTAQDDDFLKKLSAAADGSFVLHADAAAIQDTISRAVDKARNPYVAETPVNPRHAAVHAITAGLVPGRLEKHNRLGVKPGAETLLAAGTDEAPEAILALWQAGLGRSAVLAVPYDAAWSAWLRNSEDGLNLLLGLIGSLARTEEKQVAASCLPLRKAIRIVPDAQEERHESLKVTISRIGGERTTQTTAFLTGDGYYEAHMPDIEPGLYILAIGEKGGKASVPLAVPAPSELLRTGIDEVRLRALEAAGAEIITENALDGKMAGARPRESAIPYWLAFMLLTAGWIWRIFGKEKRLPASSER